MTEVEDTNPALTLVNIALGEDREELTPGSIMRAMEIIRDERRAISARDEILVEQWRTLEMALLTTMDEQGVRRASGDTVTATITTEEVPNVIDWDEFLRHIVETNSPHLLQRRVATRAWRELLHSDQPTPGIEPFNQRKISLRKRS